MVKACMASFKMPYPVHPHQWLCPMLRDVDGLPLWLCPSHPKECESVGPKPLVSVAEGGTQAQEAPILAFLPGPGGHHPGWDTPLCVNMGPLRGFIIARFRVTMKDLLPPMQPFASMWTGPTWAWRCPAFPCLWTLLNSDTLMQQKNKSIHQDLPTHTKLMSL